MYVSTSEQADEIVKTLEALRILPLLSYPPVLSWDVEASKPSPEMFKRACELCEEQRGQGVIMVGDELKACVSSYVSRVC
jgi:phosphoglycolate phosphatase-like HAD superfamily hydrolase